MKCPWRDDLWAENKSALSRQRDEGLGAGKGDGREVKRTGVRLCITNHRSLLVSKAKKVQLLKQYATVVYKKKNQVRYFGPTSY